MDERRIRVLSHPSTKRFAELACVLLAYFVAGRLGQATTAIRSNNLGPVWPAYGVALGAIILCGYRIWPAITAGAFLVAFLSPVGAVVALGQAIAATLAALTGTFLLTRVAGFDRSMARLRDAVWLVMLGAFGSALISASLGTLALYTGHVTPYAGIPSSWLVYWLGDSTGVLLVTPLVLTLTEIFRIRARRELLEFGLLMALVTTSSFIVFAGNLFVSVSLNFLAFGILPFVMWSAIRFGTAATSLSVLIVATIATIETAFGSGPFGGDHPFTNAVLLDIFFAVVAITGLTLAGAIAERKRAERTREELVREQTATEARLRLASIIESSDDAIVGAQLDGTITDWNKGAELLFGYMRSEVMGKYLLLLLADSAQRELRDIFYDLRYIASMNRYDSLCEKKDGTRFEAEVRVSPIFDASGQICGGSVIVRDITFRKRQEAILRESEARFRLVADTAPVLIWMSGADKLGTYFSKPWLDFTGQTLESQLGNGWAGRVHPDDLNRCLITYTRCFDRRENFRIEYRLQRYDGEFRWVLDCGVPRFNFDGSFAGYISSCIDVTENKLAEEAIATVNGRLIEAQEKERTRIARELHDDINQRLALLAVEIGQATLNDPDPSAKVRTARLSKRISEISDDVQAISHDLHSFKLEHLGMLAAMRSFCTEFAGQQQLWIDFVHDEGPFAISNDVALTLFRVLQEALHNAFKHSQGRHFKVELRCSPRDISLQITDWGVGFDPENVRTQSGLGFVSMRERIKLIKGTIEVESKPMAGTVVRARVPADCLSESNRQAEQDDDPIRAIPDREAS
jgi:PAS domain S-box-containing protein